MKRTVSTVILNLLVCCASAVAGDRPIVGAIRWDAWTGGAVTREVERSLGPAKYRDRLPWFAEVVDEQTVRIDGSPQRVMDREIDYAADAGLDYWAFLLYPKSDTMSVGLSQYLKSPKRSRIGFCVILHNAFNVGADQWPAERDRAIALLKEPGYQRVLGDRPLVFAFGLMVGGKVPTDRLAEFRHAAGAAGLNPYLVWMGWHPPADFAERSRDGFDAVSAYAWPGEQQTFAELVKAVETAPWASAAKSNTPFVPLVTTGWDKRPRKDHPVSWEKDQAYHKQAVFPSTAAPAEIAAHLSRSLRFVGEHRQICAANAVIMYAWNEHDEGGWLSPTWAGADKADTSRLDAVRTVLKPTTQPAGH